MSTNVTRVPVFNFFLIAILLNLTLACAQQQNPESQSSEISKISNEQIIDYVRKAFNVRSNIQISVTDATSNVAGLRAIKLEFKSDRGSQTQDAWITKGNQLIVGRIMDLNVDPYKKNLEKISFTNVPTTGSADAKVTIVEYSDFQCPFCSRAHLTMEELLKEYEGKVKLLYKHLPLSMHNWAEDAAVAGTCVYQQNNEAFWKMAHELFANQKEIKKETLTAKVFEVAAQSKLDEAQLKQCIETRQTLPVVKANETEAKSLGFGSTPSFVINGREVVGALELKEYKQIVDEALATAN